MNLKRYAVKIVAILLLLFSYENTSYATSEEKNSEEWLTIDELISIPEKYENMAVNVTGYLGFMELFSGWDGGSPKFSIRIFLNKDKEAQEGIPLTEHNLSSEAQQELMNLKPSSELTVRGIVKKTTENHKGSTFILELLEMPQKGIQAESVKKAKLAQVKKYDALKGYEKFAQLVLIASAKSLDSSVIHAINKKKMNTDNFVIFSSDSFGQVDLESWPETYRYRQENQKFSFYSWFPVKNDTYRAMPSMFISDVNIPKRRYQQVLGKLIKTTKVKQVKIMPDSILETFDDVRGYKRVEDFLNESIDMPVFKVIAVCGFNGVDLDRGTVPDKALMSLVCTYNPKEVKELTK